MGEESTWLDVSDMKRIPGSDYYLSGLLTPKTVTIQAAAYVRGFAKGLSRNVNIYENSPVIAMTRADGIWKVNTPKGSVSAPKVLLCVKSSSLRQRTPSKFWIPQAEANAHFSLRLNDTCYDYRGNPQARRRTQLGCCAG